MLFVCCLLYVCLFVCHFIRFVFSLKIKDEWEIFFFLKQPANFRIGLRVITNSIDHKKLFIFIACKIRLIIPNRVVCIRSFLAFMSIIIISQDNLKNKINQSEQLALCWIFFFLPEILGKILYKNRN